MTGGTGRAGGAGATVSRTIAMEGLVADLFPAASVTVASIVHVPSDISGRLQLVTEDDAVYVHETVVPSAFLPVIVTESPVTAFGIPKAGVVSFVRLSVFDGPLSEAGIRSGASGAGGVESIEIASEGETAEVFPAGSVTVPMIDHVPSASLPRLHEPDAPEAM